jgi:capsular polysaccharide export protein
MGGRIAIFSHGLWRLRTEIETMTGMTPVRALLQPRGVDAVAGWGHKPTARRAREFARKEHIPYIAFEDGFLRSVKPGAETRPLSMVMDRTGIYYDARSTSDIESLLNSGEVFSDAELLQARDAMARIATLRLSKYNQQADEWPEGMPSFDALVVDQTLGDASIEGGLASEASFAAMLNAAIATHGRDRVLVKTHPEVSNGVKRGYLQGRGLPIAPAVNPWRLFYSRPHVYTVSSQLGFEAAMAGCKVDCHGVPFYSGWGITADHQSVPRRTRRRSIKDIFTAAYLRSSRYFDAWTRAPIDLATAIDQLAFLRDACHRNGSVVLYRMPRWKRHDIARLLEGPKGWPESTNDLGAAIQAARQSKGAVAAWGRKSEAVRKAAQAANVDSIAIEDGFIRSLGLGSSFNPSVSFAFDARGIYYDPSSPSDLESLLSNHDFDKTLVARAAALRQDIVSSRMTKYNLRDEAVLPQIPQGGRVILTVGQVADDESIRLGADPSYLTVPLADGGSNLRLLTRARERHPDAFIIYKPHPDVETMGRAGRIAPEIALRHADFVATQSSITQLFDIADRVETVTSLAGFEALIRGIKVACHGTPFYSGWCLTDDLFPVARRGRQLSIDELVAATLILYPRYLDPESGLPCPPEVAVRRLRTPPRSGRFAGGLDMFKQVLGRIVIAAKRR